MAQIAVSPIVLRDVTLSVGTDSYEKHISGVTFTPSAGTVNWTGLSPDAVFTFPTSTTWTAQLDYAQDWDTTNSLSRYLFDNEGEEVVMTFRPKSGGVGFEATVIIVPGAIGGSVNQVATATVTLPVQGRPATVDAVVIP